METLTIKKQDTASPAKAMAHKKPIVIIVIGMAGSGKMTLMQCLISHVQSSKKRDYVLNLDLAVMSLPFTVNIDILDIVNYKNVMEYHLGPNRGFSLLSISSPPSLMRLWDWWRHAQWTWTMFLGTLLGRSKFSRGQRLIVVEAFASCYPTIVTYVVDTPRSVNSVTFMSNMLYWMDNFEAFQGAVEGDSSYSSSLSHSLCLVLDEFYKNLCNAGVSAVTGEGIVDFFNQVDKCADDYMESYWPNLERRKAEKAKLESKQKEANLVRLQNDLAKSQGQTVVFSAPRHMEEDDEEEEGELEEDDDDDTNDADGEEDHDGQFFREIGNQL